jgi:hypothetical protein
MEAVQPAEAHRTLDLRRYSPVGSSTVQAYQRRAGARDSGAPDTYERRYRGFIRAEGTMATNPVWSLADFLGPDAPRAGERWKLWPVNPESKGAAFFLEFNPPLVYLPASITPNGAVSQEVTLRYYNRDGILRRTGTVERAITLEGFENVGTDGMHFANCARLKVDTRIRVKWGPRVDLTEYLWLAPGIGEVRRVQRFSGFAYLVYFSQVQSFELASSTTGQQDAGAGTTFPGEVWTRCAVYLDRLPPHPRLGGLVVELATDSADRPSTP